MSSIARTKKNTSVKNLAFTSVFVYSMACVMRRSSNPSWAMFCASTGRRQRATSVLEMLVVVLIVGIVMAMLLPSLKRSLDLAHAAVCMHNLREIGHSLTLYRVENDGWLPGSKPVVETARSTTSEAVWFMKLYPNYLVDPVALTCPCDPYRYRMVKSSGRLDDPAVVDYASYGINSVIVYGGGGRLADVDRHMPTRVAAGLS